jgi:RHS repeat-associated protein
MQTFIYDSIPRFVYLYTFNPSRYTGKERDTESGLDNFGARYFGSTMGRFTSPDPLGFQVADYSNPQSWNFYSYAFNNPFKYTDPTGFYSCAPDTTTNNDDGSITVHAGHCYFDSSDFYHPTVSRTITSLPPVSLRSLLPTQLSCEGEGEVRQR